MNRNYLKALLAIGVLGTMASAANAQANGQGFGIPPFDVPYNKWTDVSELDWVVNCIDPTSTTPPWSPSWAVAAYWDSMFGASVGLSGTTNFSKVCFPPNGITNNVQGRVGFFIGTDPNPTNPDGSVNYNYGTGGSLQDGYSDPVTHDLVGQGIDDGMTLTFGGYTGVSGNFAISNIVQSTTATTGGTPTIKMEYYGKNAIDTFFFGLSNRYFVTESTASLGARVKLQVDILGDTAKLTWQIQNTGTGTNIGLGLWFGQWVFMNSPAQTNPTFPIHAANYITVPGLKPLNSDTRFTLNPNTANPLVPELQLPPYVDFGMYQSWAYGLQVVLSPSQQIPDQTQADGIDVGAWDAINYLVDSPTATDGVMTDFLDPDTGILGGAAGYIEKFQPTPVAAYSGNPIGQSPDTRTIVAYYRSTWSTADYSAPYSVVLDAPPVVATTAGNPGSFQNSPFNLFIHIDNTLGFSSNQKEVPLEDVEVDVDLPAGMTDASNPNSNHMVQYLNIVEPQTISNLLFKVAVDPRLFGNQQYKVTVIPNPGPTKQLFGTIAVASQPYLQLTGTANLVTAPWQFAQSDWATIIGQNSGLTVDQDFQVFGWDALAQSYVLQTDPQRGFGSFVITNQNVGFVPLGGSPQQAPDLQSGAPQIILQPGWNLVANPYNYAIPLGELVGVPEANNTASFTFTELATEGYVSGSLSFWNAQSQGYETTGSFADLLQPNTGYWLYVASDLPVTILYPPVFQAFLPGLVDDEVSTFAKKAVGAVTLQNSPIWTLQLAARSNGMIDANTAIGQTTTAKLASVLTRYKPPIAPVKNAISSSILMENGKKVVNLAQALTSENIESQIWTWNVFTQNSGEVTLTWPNMNKVPSNVQVKIVDPETGSQRNLREATSVSYPARAQGLKTYKLVVTTGPSLPVIESVTAAAGKAAENIAYKLSVNSTSTVTITQSGQVIATLVNNRNDQEGQSTATWNFLDAANRQVKNGTYEAVVTSTPSGGSTSTKSVAFTVKR